MSAFFDYLAFGVSAFFLISMALVALALILACLFGEAPR